jgi:hypothetical protein
MGSFFISTAAGLLLVASLVSAASAQRPTTPAPKQDTPAPSAQQQQRCAPSSGSLDQSRPETRGQAAPELGDRLSKSNGVICPPTGVDPEIATPPPGGGKTPVIPPPGTPGGNPNIIPK